MIGKKKIVLFLLLWFVVAIGIYIAAVKAFFVYITPIYMGISVLLMILYIPPFLKNAKMKITADAEERKFTPSEQEIYNSRAVKMKYYLILFIPIMFVLLGDYMYIEFFSKSGLIEAIKSYYAK